MSELEFDKVANRVWEFYGKKHGYTKAEYTLKIITGVNGPVVCNTVQLDNRRDLFVLFERQVRATHDFNVNILYSEFIEFEFL
jgi:hypothetical protein